MKALTLQQIKSPLILEDRPAVSPGPREVIVQLKAAALNRRDYWITQGMYPGVKPPVVLGSDGAGVVTQLGEEIGHFWRNAEVVIDPAFDWGDNSSVQGDSFTILGLPRDGTFATEVAVPVSQLHSKPKHLNWQESAAIPLAGLTAYRAMFSQGELKEGERVLITGVGGGVATFALQFAAAAGASVWVTSSSDEKIQRAVALGAVGGFNYKDENWWKEMAKTVGPANLIIDSAGGAGYAALVNLTAPGGRIVNYGATAGPPPKLDLFKVFWKQLRIQGTTMGAPADFEAMLEFINQHGIRPVIDREFPLAEGNEALNLMESSPQFGKYVLTME